jgi:hypothetical protein
MNEDSFARAARALRENYDGTSEQSDATRRSVLVRAMVERRRRRRVAAYVVPLAAVLALSTAWAAVTGRLPWRLEGSKGRTSPSAQVLPGGHPTAAPAPGAPADEPPEPLVPAAADSGGDAAPADAPPAPPRADRPHAHPSSAPRPGSSSTDAEESLYATAHRIHFVDHDPASALKAWDSYLATYPNGRFALEARYNRALTLVRLDRRDEARAALAPFADGTYGGYRQREAGELLDALQGPR